MENLLTIEEAATRLKVNPETVRRQLRAGRLRGVKRGKWRVPESALFEPMPVVSGTEAASDPAAQAQEMAQEMAQEIMSALRSRDGRTRNTAIINLMRATPEVRAIVEAAAAKAAGAYYATPAGQSELDDWHALDGEPFPDDAGDARSGAA